MSLPLEEELERLLGRDLAVEVCLILVGRCVPVDFPERDQNGRSGVMFSLGPGDPTPAPGDMAMIYLGGDPIRLGVPKRYRNGQLVDD